MYLGTDALKDLVQEEGDVVREEGEE